MASEFRLSKIGLIMLGVSDLKKSVEFYRDRLGMEMTGQSAEFAFFNAGGVTLALSTGITSVLGKEPGAVEVDFSVDHVRAAYTELRNKGVEFVNQPRVINPPLWGANFRDPDGHMLAIFGPE
jgi:catechol 2,3-dioxygenase-like lactoylglutathione lyase family enzyme